MSSYSHFSSLIYVNVVENRGVQGDLFKSSCFTQTKILVPRIDYSNCNRPNERAIKRLIFGQFYLFLSMPFVVLCALLLLVSKFSEREFSSINGAECGAIVEWKMTDDDKKPAEQEAEPVKLDKPVGPPTRQYKDGFDPRRIKNSDE